ncbi:MAG: hypothetical protein MJY85_07300 [Fibrobacter sp.]|nr:hypothetical protein [Fibrobacter sp.]
MTPLMNALACLLSLGFAMFLWRERSDLYRNSLLIIGILVLDMVFTYFGAEVGTPSEAALLESYPFKMLGLSLCFSTTSLRHKRRRYLVIAQVFWLWVEVFGGISLFYRGIDISWLRVVAIGVMAFFSSMLSGITKEMEFCLMVFWIAIWTFF